MPDFWPSSGYRLLATGADNRLTLTEDFLRASLLRPELAPFAPHIRLWGDAFTPPPGEESALCAASRTERLSSAMRFWLFA